MGTVDLKVTAREYRRCDLEQHLCECLDAYSRLLAEFINQREHIEDNLMRCQFVLDTKAFAAQQANTPQQLSEAYTELFEAQQEYQRALDTAAVCRMLEEASHGPREASLAKLKEAYKLFAEDRGDTVNFEIIKSRRFG